MKALRNLVLLVVIFALAITSIVNVSATNGITELEVGGIEVVDTTSTVTIAGFYRDSVPVRIEFESETLDEEVRIKAWFSGSGSNTATTARFSILPDVRYSRTISVNLPTDFDNYKTEEAVYLTVLIESRNGGEIFKKEIAVQVQRDDYSLEILDVDMQSKVTAGDSIAVDVVVKNRGRIFADDSFVVVRIPELGITDKAYFGDLSSVDQFNPDKEDAVEKRLYLRLPASVKSGVYTVEIEAYNDDSIARTSRSVVVSGSEANTIVVAPSHSKTFAVGEKATYTLNLVNTGNKVAVYNIFAESESLDLTLDESVVIVPAGTSKTVKVMAEADKEDTYGFTVSVFSDSVLVKEESFTANAEGTSKNVAGTNITVLLTVILAIVFVVLLVVLIVLLTRKPAKADEFGESYY